MKVRVQCTLVRAAAFLLTVALSVGPAHADGDADAVASPDAAPPRAGVHWDAEWPKVGVPELVGGAVVVGGAALARFLPEPPPARWRGGILLDGAARDGLRLSTARGRRSAGTVSDVLWWTSMGWPLLIDPVLVALLAHDSPAVAAQLSWIAFETLALSAFLATSSENLGRQRPRALACDDGAGSSAYCDSGEANRSFLSGHALASFAGAGLTCAAHQSLPLYGGGAADVLACAGSVVVATATGVLRIASDNHWTSDVLVSSGLGFALGYLLPKALHFGFGNGRGGRRPAAHLVPLLGDGLTGLALAL